MHRLGKDLRLKSIVKGGPHSFSMQIVQDLFTGVGHNNSSVSQKVWEKYDERRKDEPIWSWLPLMHDELIAAIASEVKWTLQNLPDHYPAIIISLLHTFFLKHQSTLTQQMSSNLHSGKLLAS